MASAAAWRCAGSSGATGRLQQPRQQPMVQPTMGHEKAQCQPSSCRTALSELRGRRESGGCGLASADHSSYFPRSAGSRRHTFCLIMVRHQHHPCTAYLVTNHLFRVHYSTLRPCCRLSCSSSAHAHMSARHFPGSLNAGKGKSRPSHIPRYN